MSRSAPGELSLAANPETSDSDASEVARLWVKGSIDEGSLTLVDIGSLGLPTEFGQLLAEAAQSAAWEFANRDEYAENVALLMIERSFLFHLDLKRKLDGSDQNEVPN